jgi:ABC-type phosphate transport system substrate-binding protein
MKLRRKFGVALAAASMLAPLGVIPAHAASTVNGGGSSFLANMADICRAQYGRSSYNTNADTVNYTASSSGTGRTSFANNTFTWAGADSPYSSGAPSNFVYVPLIAGAISVMYHVEGVTPANTPIRLSPTTIGKIFAGQITNWSDANIKADNLSTTIAATKKVTKNGVTVTVAKSGSKLNFVAAATTAGLTKFKGKKLTIIRTGASGVKTQLLSTAIAKSTKYSVGYSKGASYAVAVGTTSLGSLGVDNTTSGTTLTFPSTPIKVAYRSGTSGTTNNFTNFLHNAAGSLWTNAANDSFSSAFPGTVPTDGTFQSASGSDGVANYVRDNNGAITYTELSYATERANADKNIGYASVKNNAGVYVAPSAAAVSAFYAEAAIDASGLVVPDYTVANTSAYLVNAVSYGLAYTATSTDNTAVKNWFSYFVNQCAPSSAAGAYYAPLSGSILAKAQAQIAKISAS